MENDTMIENLFGDLKDPTAGDKKNSEKKDSGKSQQKNDPAEFWVNVGYKAGGKLVSLPQGIPLDRLKAKPIPSPSTKNQDFRMLRAAQHDLWERVQKLMSTLKPGESKELPFVVEIRRVEEKDLSEQEEEVNPYKMTTLKF